jgi:hypothetical protein
MPTPQDKAIRAERRLLAALCQGFLPHETREQIRQRLAQHLAQHGFQLPEDEIIFRAATELLSGAFSDNSSATSPRSLPDYFSPESERMREALTAKVTRMGFPDTDIDQLFRSEATREEEIPGLFKELAMLDTRPTSYQP